jgi:hypothetical protein
MIPAGEYIAACEQSLKQDFLEMNKCNLLQEGVLNEELD